MSKLELYLSLAEKIVRRLQEKNLEGEVYLEYSSSKYACAQENKLKECGSQDELGLALRVVHEGRIGLVYTSDLDKLDIDSLIESCLKVAKLNSPVPQWIGFPSKSPSASISEIFSEKLLEVDLENLVSEIKDLLSRLKEDRRLYLYYAAVSVDTEERAILNTSGLRAQERATCYVVSIELVAAEGGQSTPAVHDADYSRTSIVPIDKVYERCREKTLSLLNPETLQRKDLPVVLTERALFELLSFTLADVLTARAFALRRSPFVGKIGKQILSEKITLIDDATLPGKYGSVSFDDEGVETRRLVLVERGVLRNIVTDLYWACFIGIKPTGHGFRAGYTSVPSIAYTNIVIEPGNMPVNEILEGESEYLLVDDLQGAHSSNPESGEFSVAAPCAWIVKKGERIPIRGIMLSGNIYEALKGDIELTREQFEFLGRISPYIVLRSSVKIVTK